MDFRGGNRACEGDCSDLFPELASRWSKSDLQSQGQVAEGKDREGLSRPRRRMETVLHAARLHDGAEQHGREHGEREQEEQHGEAARACCARELESPAEAAALGVAE
jgi:hypothetical protein